jgi:hypothetical protein
MIDKIHCSECGFLMMIEAKGSNIVYTCVNTHGAVIEDNGLGPNLDILMEYLKRP